MRLALASAGLFALTACDLPRDTAGTSERARTTPIRVGQVEDGRNYSQQPADRLLAALGARGRIESDAAEPLLARLEQGELDLVLGRFDAKSPWEARVTFARHTFHGFRVATRNGEHRWAMTVDRAITDAKP